MNKVYRQLYKVKSKLHQNIKNKNFTIDDVRHLVRIEKILDKAENNYKGANYGTK